MSIKKGMSGHQSASSKTNSWITPIEILKPLGEFDLDPCAALSQPWPTAKNYYTELDNGLEQSWFGRVWLNPPYSSELIIRFMEKMARHGNGIALTFARTETKFFHQYVFPIAESIFFFERRLTFYTTEGVRASANSGAPSVLISYGSQNADTVESAGFKGKHVPVNYTPMLIVGVSPTWFSVICIALKTCNDNEMSDVYETVEQIAPDKVVNNPNWKAKVRQQVQQWRKFKSSKNINH